MSHEIIQGKDHMVSVGNNVPWHKLGTVLADPAITAMRAVVEAKLDWEVKQEHVFDVDMSDLADYRLLRRSDTKDVLSIVPKDWTPLQNIQLLEIAEALAQAPGAGDFKPVIETAGSLRGGKVVWALVQTGLRTFAGSQHKQYMLLTNGHYLGRGVRGTLTDVRVVCNNTLTAAENAKAALFTTHYGDVTARIESAIAALGWATEATRATFAIYEALAATHCPKDKAVELFTGLFPLDDEGKTSKGDAEKVEAMAALFQVGAGNEGKSYFDVVNAVTDWVDHYRNFREDDNTDERRFLDVNIAGNGVSMKTKAVKLARKMALAVA